MFFKAAQKVTKYLGYLTNKICNLEFSKFAQSGHTDWTQQQQQNLFKLTTTRVTTCMRCK